MTMEPVGAGVAGCGAPGSGTFLRFRKSSGTSDLPGDRRRAASSGIVAARRGAHSVGAAGSTASSGRSRARAVVGRCRRVGVGAADRPDSPRPRPGGDVAPAHRRSWRRSASARLGPRRCHARTSGRLGLGQAERARRSAALERLSGDQAPVGRQDRIRVARLRRRRCDRPRRRRSGATARPVVKP